MTIPSYRSIDIEPNDEDLLQNHDSSLIEDDDDNGNGGVASTRLHPPLRRSNSIPRHKRLSATAAALALMKGNLGPGILNLPHAFARAGPTMGSALFLIVSLQGLYSMTLLVSCKNWIVHSIQREEGGLEHPADVQTFMDVTQFALGNVGGRLTELFVFVLQLGVCCVFISLIATNLQAAFLWLSSILAISLIALFMMVAVLIRFIKDLFWLNAIANTFMFIAILTATIASLVNIYRGLNQSSSSSDSHGTLSAGVSFTADMFFAFEGIGLVLPVENNYLHPHASNATGNTKRWPFSSVLLVSMSCVAILFALTGLTASIGFPDIASASVTAYLKHTYPKILWFSIVNLLVLVAVALTFPLQLTPAMEVLEKWLAELPRNPSQCGRLCARHRIAIDDDAVTPNASLEIEMHVGHNSIAATPTTVSASIWNQYSWVVRRWLVVLSCAAFVYMVDDLGILVSLFGAVGQTGLAGMPCAVHLVLQRRHLAPRNMVRTVADVVILVFCTLVMISGCSLSIHEIVNKKR